jgi:hypothetical protein
MIFRVLCSSAAKLESDTLTTVASRLTKKEPITATAVIFQTDGCKPPEFSELSGKGGGHLMNLSSLAFRCSKLIFLP